MNATPAGWYADPEDGRRWRWWDGAHWTEHTSVPAAAPDAFWSAPLLYVRNHASVGSFQTAVYDGSGTQIAAMTAGGIHMGLTNVTLPIVDPRGAPLLVMREAYSISFGGFGGGSRALRVEDGGGRELGSILLRSYGPRHFNFDLGDPGGAQIGAARMEDYGSLMCLVHDTAGAEVARTGRAEAPQGGLFTVNDFYSIALHRPVPEALDRVTLALLIGWRQILEMSRHSGGPQHGGFVT
jgi:hypothetical protein